MQEMLPPSFFAREAPELAAALLGCELVHESPEGRVAGRIVEVEAYRQTDPASHAFGGPTTRNATMFGPPGHAYMYFSYGVHYCMNAVAGRDGAGEGVLIRALEPTEGLELMARRRNSDTITNLCSGPGKLTQALGLGRDHNGISLTGATLYLRPRMDKLAIAVSPRIGISRGTETLWRFFVLGNPHVSSHKFNNRSIPWKYGADLAAAS